MAFGIYFEFSLSVKNGQLEMDIGSFNRMVIAGVPLNDGNVHEVSLMFNTFDTEITIDGILRGRAESYSYDISGTLVYIGGTPETPSIMTNGLYNNGFYGCIEEVTKVVHTNSNLVHLINIQIPCTLSTIRLLMEDQASI